MTDHTAALRIVREAIEATFEQRPGFLTLVSQAVRALPSLAQPQQPATPPAPAEPQSLRRLIENDAYAATFQSLAQYRTALLTHTPDVVGVCPRCDGSGEETIMSDNSPDAHEVQIDCTHCKGHGGLMDAYNGLVETLRMERAAHLRAAGERLLAPPPQQPAQGWQNIATAPKDGTEIWAFNGEQARMKWSQGDGWALWVWADELLSDADPEPDQPTHYMPLPVAPGTEPAQGQDAKEPERFVVLKASGSRYAYVNDTLLGKTVKRYDILRGGWINAELHAARLNRDAAMTAAQDAVEGGGNG